QDSVAKSAEIRNCSTPPSKSQGKETSSNANGDGKKNMQCLPSKRSFKFDSSKSETIFGFNHCRLQFEETEEWLCFLFIIYLIGSIKMLEEIDISAESKTEEVYAHELRVGWATADQPLRLGERAGSFAYCSNGKIATKNFFTAWGPDFWPNDVVACLIDYEQRTLSMMKNGECIGVAFQLDKKQDAPVLFPCITTKNVRFEVNFGQMVSLMLSSGLYFGFHTPPRPVPSPDENSAMAERR
ncbi:unnamed protein product, partial [Soboliphyme baturini]|uniref:B30.2/SPRY domain-containing protein n=1 Tax=Soboliphyme baturini TaxID=241478 RepID=A0A183J7N0_9BILA